MWNFSPFLSFVAVWRGCKALPETAGRTVLQIKSVISWAGEPPHLTFCFQRSGLPEIHPPPLFNQTSDFMDTFGRVKRTGNPPQNHQKVSAILRSPIPEHSRTQSGRRAGTPRGSRLYQGFSTIPVPHGEAAVSRTVQSASLHGCG